MNKFLELILDYLKNIGKNFLENFAKSPLEMIVALIAIFILGPTLFDFLYNNYGILTGIGFIISLILSLCSGKLAENPYKILSSFVGYALASIATNLAIDYLFKINADGIAAIVGLIVAIAIWIRSNELKNQ